LKGSNLILMASVDRGRELERGRHILVGETLATGKRISRKVQVFTRIYAKLLPVHALEGRERE